MDSAFGDKNAKILEDGNIGSDCLVRAIAEAGVDTIFGVPGDTGVAFYDALYRNSGLVRHVLARDERHAVIMADAYARLTGRVGTVEVSSGGGTTYAVGGMGEAYSSGIPLVLIASDIHRSSRGTGALTEIDQVALFSAVTKWTKVVESPDDIGAVVQDAYRIAAEDRPGPVAVIVPEDLLDAVCDRKAQSKPASAPAGLPALSGDLANAAALLNEARQPAIVAGSGIHNSSAYEALAALAQKIGAAVATTIHGRGVICDDHPCAVGLVGNNGGQPGPNELVSKADVVLLVGTRANATDTNGFTTPARGLAKIIRIDIDTQRVRSNYPDSLQLRGDARQILEDLTARLRAPEPDVLSRRLIQIKQTRSKTVDPHRPPVAKMENGLIPADVLRIVAEKLPADTPIAADPGTPTPNVANYWPVTTVGRKVIIPRGHGPMGYAIPAAVGMAFGAPGTPIVSVTADGSFAMACGELETITRYDLPILYLQLTNFSLGWIKMLQHLYYDGRYFGVDPGPIDAVKVAEASGMRAFRATDLVQLAEIAEQFSRDRKPTYVDIVVPHMIDHTPPVPAWHQALAGDKERPIY